MVFCNKHYENIPTLHKEGHNPYFNRWFSAILDFDGEELEENSHNPYFNRWFSAIRILVSSRKFRISRHNPYFNRWFSAIYRISKK